MSIVAMEKRLSFSGEFHSPVVLLARYFRLGAKKESQFSTAEMEERQAALFGYAYSVGKGFDSFVVRPGEGPLRDYDAEFRWSDHLLDRRQPVSLKRLPPKSVNPNETLAGIIRKAAIKSTGGDLLLAIQVDRTGQLESLTIPKIFRIKELCLWGWSKPQHAELFVNSYIMGEDVSRQWFTRFPPPGFQTKE